MLPDAYCFHRRFEPTGAPELRVDRHYLLYAMEGALRLEAGGRRWTLPPARAALIAADEPITVSVLSRVTSASVLYTTELASPPRERLCVFEVSRLARELFRECSAYGPDDGPLDPYARRLFEALVAVAMRLAERPSPCVLPTPSSAALRRALDLTEARSSERLVVEDIARATGQSPRSLARRFAHEMGLTWTEALRRIRILRAVELLVDPNASVSEVALEVGYRSLSGFNRAFREITGENPTTYRASFVE